MKIWIVQVGEPTPTEDAQNERLMRSGLLANCLANRGHKVTWWATTFDHARKSYRYYKQHTYEMRGGVTIKYLHPQTPYKRNVSLARIKNHKELAEQFKIAIAQEETPDLILTGMPTPELCAEAVQYGNQKQIATFLDIRDLWPDDIIHLIPKLLKPLARLVLKRMENTVENACENANGICATSPIFVNWGLKYAKRSQSTLDMDFPLGYSNIAPKRNEEKRAQKFWESKGIKKNNDEFLLCFFGALGRTCTLPHVFEAMNQLQNKKIKVKLIICGKGDREIEFKKYSKGINNVSFIGWVGRPEIWTLMRMADAGLVPVKNIYSYMSNYPNKTIEYLSAGLPLISSLKGIVGKLIEDEKIGFVYDEKNPDELIQNLIHLIKNPSIKKKMATNAKKIFNTRFSSEIVYNSFAKHLEQSI
ncbi:glycosyltransferase family 4 protein [Verrucomicrobiales bacterium]|nr:glycosyltransferase family 4 protein [Verrucomicrobiales bacterium]